MAVIRVRVVNAENMCNALKEAGFEAEWRKGASTDWQGMTGCNDPGHCPQHPDAEITWHGSNWGTARMNPEVWATITTNAPKNQAGKIWKRAGIKIQHSGWQFCNKEPI